MKTTFIKKYDAFFCFTKKIMSFFNLEMFILCFVYPGKLMDNTPHNHSTDTRRPKIYIVLPVESGQRMLEFWKFQWSYGNYSWTQVINYLYYIFNITFK